MRLSYMQCNCETLPTGSKEDCMQRGIGCGLTKPVDQVPAKEAAIAEDGADDAVEGAPAPRAPPQGGQVVTRAPNRGCHISTLVPLALAAGSHRRKAPAGPWQKTKGRIGMPLKTKVIPLLTTTSSAPHKLLHFHLSPTYRVFNEGM